jgi:aspartate aminotransferase-like enzyme
MSEGLDQVVARHRAAAAATRAALGPLGLEAWVQGRDEAAAVATLVRAPAPGASDFVRACLDRWRDGPVPIAPAPGALGEQAFRVNHTGRRASLTAVWTAVAALAGGLEPLGARPDVGACLDIATTAWHQALGSTPG